MSVENSVKPYEEGNEAVWYMAGHHQDKWYRCDLKHRAVGNFYNVDHERSQTEGPGKFLKPITLLLHV